MTFISNTVIKIECSLLPAIYPVVAYKDTFFTYNRPIPDGLHTEEYFTDRKFQTIDNDFYDNVLIQRLIYSRYKIKILVSESWNLNLIAAAGKVNITLKNGTIHYARILSLDQDKLEDTEFRLYEISYFDYNPANYNDTQPVNDFLKKTFLLERFAPAQLTRLFITKKEDVLTYDPDDFTMMQFYSMLVPVKGVSEVELNESDVNGLKVVSKSISQDTYECRFYVDKEEARLMQKFMPRCDDVLFGMGISTVKWKTATSIERIIPEVVEVEGAVDLWQVDFSFKIKNLYLYPYEYDAIT